MTWKKYSNFFFTCHSRSTQLLRFCDDCNCDLTRLTTRSLFWNFFIFAVRKLNENFKNFFISQAAFALLRRNYWIMTLSIKFFLSSSKISFSVFSTSIREVLTLFVIDDLSVFVTLRVMIDVKFTTATMMFFSLFCNVKKHISSFI